MKTFFALLAICAGNLPVSGEFPSQRPLARSFVIFDLCLNKRSSKLSRRRRSETTSHSLRRHCNKWVVFASWLLIGELNWNQPVSRPLQWRHNGRIRHHDIETFSALLAFGEGIPPVTDSRHKWLVMCSFDVFFVVCINNLLNTQSSYKWHQTQWRPCDVGKKVFRVVL